MNNRKLEGAEGMGLVLGVYRVRGIGQILRESQIVDFLGV